MIRKTIAILMLAVILAWPIAVWAATFDATKSQGQLLDWTLLNHLNPGTTVAAVETGELDSGEGLDAALSAILHVDMCHKDGDAAGDEAAFIVFIKSGTTDERWQEFIRLEASGGTANIGDCDRESSAASNQVALTSTTNFEVPGDVYFLCDETTLADSCLVVNAGDYDNDDDIDVMDDLVNTYDADDNLYDIVDQWNIRLPAETSAAKVLFYNTDADASYAVRVLYSFVTDVDDA